MSNLNQFPDWMFNFIKYKVSQGRNRYVDEKYDLDLSYITPNIIAMGFPAEGLTSYYRNDINEVSSFLEEKHQGTYMLWNLSKFDYDISKFNNQVLVHGFPDHHNPPLQFLIIIVKSVDSWLSANKDHVAVIHCMAGKGRTGTVICSYLLYKQLCSTSKDALEFFRKKRSGEKETSVDEPSQIRYIEYFEAYLKGKDITPKKFILNQILIQNLLDYYFKGQIQIEIYEFSKREDSNSYEKKLLFSSKNVTLLKGNTLLFPIFFEVYEDVIIDCICNWSFTSEVLFRYCFHTAFVESGTIITERNDLDETYKQKSDIFKTVQFVLEDVKSNEIKSKE